jgi:hypothetical protein
MKSHTMTFRLTAGLVAGLLVGALAGGGRVLALAVVALFPVAVLFGTLDRMGLDAFASAGTSWYSPDAANVQPLYRHGSGAVTVDLSQAIAPGTTRTIAVQNAIGDVVVIVPDDATVVVEGQTALGNVMLLDHSPQWGLDRRDTASASPRNAKRQLRLHLLTGIGSVMVVFGSGGPA